MTPTLLVLVACVLGHGTAGADVPGLDTEPQAPADTVLSRSLGRDISASWGAIKHGFTRPLDWTGRDWGTFGVVLGVWAGTWLLDDEVSDWDQSGLMDEVERIGFAYGAPQYTALGVLVVYSGGAAIGSDGLRDTGMMVFENLVVAGVTQQALRIIVGRARPNAGEGNHSFNPFTLEDRYASFISGHSALAFGTSTILARQIDHPLATVGLYSLALTTPFGRAYSGRHWFSDVFIGSVLGYFTGSTIWRFHQGDASPEGRVQVLPTWGGMMVRVSF